MNRPRAGRNWYGVLATTFLLLLGLWFGCLDAHSADAKPATKAIAGQEHPKAAEIVFSFEPIDFRLDSSETPERHAPETMAGGVAVFDYNNDGKLDIFFANGADINTLRKDSPKYYNRLFENDGKGHFTDVTEKAGLQGQASIQALRLLIMTMTDSKISSWPGYIETRSITTMAMARSRMSPPNRDSASRIRILVHCGPSVAFGLTLTMTGYSISW